MSEMIGRKVIVPMERERGVGEVVKWEPLGHSMTDALVRFGDGGECWYSSAEPNLRPADGLGPLPGRVQAVEVARAQTVEDLLVILADHVRDVRERKPWPGAEFAKASVGNGIIGALRDAGCSEDRIKRVICGSNCPIGKE